MFGWVSLGGLSWSDFFWWILFGLSAGGIAKLIMPGKDPGGCLATALLGIAGALIGGGLGTHFFSWGTVTGFDLRSIGIAVVGSIVLLVLYRVITPRRTGH